MDCADTEKKSADMDEKKSQGKRGKAQREKAQWEAILALFAVHTGKKKDFVKKCEKLVIHVKKC
jgi:hypothetical protein